MRNRQNLLRNKSLTFWGHLKNEDMEKGISIYERIMIQQIAKSLKNSVELSKIKLEYADNEEK